MAENTGGYDTIKTIWVSDPLNREFELQTTERLKQIFPDKYRSLREAVPDYITPQFLEVGAGINPFVYGATLALVDQGIHPEVILDDVKYGEDTAKLFVYSYMSRLHNPQAKPIQTGIGENGWKRIQRDNPEKFYQIMNRIKADVNEKISLTLSSTGLPDLTVPEHFTGGTLAFTNLANYVDREDIHNLLTTPSIHSVVFTNGISAGETQYSNAFHKNRVQSSLEISQMLRDNGYVLALSILPYSESPLDKEKGLSPVIGQWWIREPHDQEEKVKMFRWIEENRTVDLLKM